MDPNLIYTRILDVSIRCDYCHKTIDKGKPMHKVHIGEFNYNIHAPWEIPEARKNYEKNVTALRNQLAREEHQTEEREESIDVSQDSLL